MSNSLNIIDLTKIIEDLQAKREYLDSAITSLLAASGAMVPTKVPVKVPEWAVLSPSQTAPKTPPKTVKRPYAKRASIIPDPPAQPDHGGLPHGANEDWMSFPAFLASPRSLVLAILRKADDPLSSADINNRVSEIRGIKNAAGYGGIVPLDEANIIHGSSKGWTLPDPSAAGILSGKYLWAPREILSDADMAAARREAIILLLRETPMVITSYIAKSLEGCKWLQAPVTKDLVKADMNYLLNQKAVERVPDTKKWFVKPGYDGL